jgi:NhaA family Na+:H+ antiporter
VPVEPRRTLALFAQASRTEATRLASILREETIGGALLLAAALLAVVWANTPWSGAYESLQSVAVGPHVLHLHLALATWAADGLLAIFFFVAGLELKREFVAGDLRDLRHAAVPVTAAFGGVLVPAILYTALNLNSGGGKGWAIPTATDIAFALAVLAVVGRNLPAALRTFLLTLAVVDDLLAIVIIAIFYTRHLSFVPLLLALIPLALFTILVQRGVRSWWLLIPLALVTWALVHASGIHATVAGVLLAFAVPARSTGHGPGLAEQFEHRFRPLSAGLAVPIFAFLSAGVTIGGLSGLNTALTDGVAIGIIVGLVVGKPAGIMAATWLLARLTKATPGRGLTWIDVLGLSILGGIGFTVSLLISELAFGSNSQRDEHAKLAILVGSVLAAVMATVLLRLRSRAYQTIAVSDTTDTES